MLNVLLKMKIAKSLITVTAASVILASAEDREFTSKVLDLEFEKREESEKWVLRDLKLAEWLKAVSKADWTELHSSQTDEFYFALYRSGEYLIFCENDRQNAFKGAATSLRAVDDEIAFSVWEKPSMWTTLKWNKEDPWGGSAGQEVYTTWKVIEGFSGDLVVSYRVKKDGENYQQVLRQTVAWTK